MITYTLDKESMLTLLNKKLAELNTEIDERTKDQENYLCNCKKELEMIQYKLVAFTEDDYNQVATKLIKEASKDITPNFFQRLKLRPFTVYFKWFDKRLNPHKNHQKVVELVKEAVKRKASILNSIESRYEYYYDEFLDYFKDKGLTTALHNYSHNRARYVKSKDYVKSLTCKKEELLKELELTNLTTTATFTTTSECKL